MLLADISIGSEHSGTIWRDRSCSCSALRLSEGVGARVSAFVPLIGEDLSRPFDTRFTHRQYTASPQSVPRASFPH